MDISQLPKVELHCHLDGILSPQMARAIHEENPVFPLTGDELEQAYPITGIENFFNWWSFIGPIDNQLTYYYPIIDHHIRKLKQQNVRYTEIMVGSGDYAHDPVQAIDEITAFREWVNRLEQEIIQVEFIAVFGRNKPPDALEMIAKKVFALYEANLICGVALAGPEPGNPVQPFQHIFRQYHEAGMSIEIHGGEWSGPESIWDALKHGYADRIGHGVTAFQDPALIDYILEHQIHIEMCPTSNLQTGGITRIEDHPIRRALDLGMNIGVNTDDPGIFLCSMESEYELLARQFGFTEADFHRIYRNAFNARFQEVLRVDI